MLLGYVLPEEMMSLPWGQLGEIPKEIKEGLTDVLNKVNNPINHIAIDTARPKKKKSVLTSLNHKDL